MQKYKKNHHNHINNRRLDEKVNFVFHTNNINNTLNIICLNENVTLAEKLTFLTNIQHHINKAKDHVLMEEINSGSIAINNFFNSLGKKGVEEL